VEIIKKNLLAPQKDVTVAETRLFSHKTRKRCDLCRCARNKKYHGCKKIDTDDDNFTHMYNRPLRDRNTKVCMWGDVPDVIIPVKFDVDRLRGFRSPRV